MFEQLGYQTSIAPKLSLSEGIEQARLALDSTWIDAANTGDLFEGLAGYRSDMDEERGVMKVTPLHSWHSHYADAFRYLVTGEFRRDNWGPRPAANLGTYA